VRSAGWALPAKKTLNASEQQRADIQIARGQWSADARLRDVERLIFFDESGVNLAMTRSYARALRGERARGWVPKNWGQSITLVAGIALRGLVAPLRLVGSMTADVFEAYVRQFVCPVLRQGDVVIVDNLSAHKRTSIAQLVQSAGATLRYLPPYSPDLSPIEPCWSKVKQAIRSAAARTLEALDEAIVGALRAVSPTDAHGWFRHCGYAVPAIERFYATVG
jgi:transposase